MANCAPGESTNWVALGSSLSDTIAADNGDATRISGSASSAAGIVGSSGRLLNPRSCVTCRKRKVKCDKLHPCSNCSRAHIECVFPSPGRAPRRSKKTGDGTRDKELLERLRRLESVVKGLGAEVPEGEAAAPSGMHGMERLENRRPDASNIDIAGRSAAQAPFDDTRGMHDIVPIESPSSGNSNNNDVSQPSIGPRRLTLKTAAHDDLAQKALLADGNNASRFENEFGRLVINEGKSRYVNNSFWANLCNEVEDLKDILAQSSDDEDAESPEHLDSAHQQGSHQGFLFKFSSLSVDLLNLHPQPRHIQSYWNIFKERVDPLVKILHIPSLEPTILDAASHLSKLPRPFECLMFAIYYGASTSLSSADCMAHFGEEKSLLLARYQFGLEQALARANFLTSEEIVVLQAFVLFLVCLRRNSDARAIWSLTGLVVRIAQTLGIHRDGLHFHLPPLEVELRRRLWWQVCILDLRASEDHGCDPTIIEQSYDTKMPLNINDSDISPDMEEFPAERKGCTDMSFCLIRFEFSNISRRLNYVPPGFLRADQHDEFSASGPLTITIQDKERWIAECQTRLDERYLNHCDMNVPLFWVTATVARLMMGKLWLMVYQPFQRQDGGAALPSDLKKKLFVASLENMEYSLLLETETRTLKWGWLFRTYVQWHALAFCLSELCHRTTGDLVDRAWAAVEKTREGRWGVQYTSRTNIGHLWRPLTRIYRKARHARQRAMQEALHKQQQQQRATTAAIPTRTYSPNANPMFGNPNRPHMIRAPLSQAQLKRFVDGPLGNTAVGLSSFAALKDRIQSGHIDTGTPNLPQQTSQTVELSNSSSVTPSFAHSRAPRKTNNLLTPSPLNLGATPSTVLPAPRAAPKLNCLPNDPTVSPSDAGTSVLFQSAIGPFSHLRSNSFAASQEATTTAPSDPLHMDLDLDPLDNDMNAPDFSWENWDMLVRQFGMDIDSMGPAGTASSSGFPDSDYIESAAAPFLPAEGSSGSGDDALRTAADTVLAEGGVAWDDLGTWLPEAKGNSDFVIGTDLQERGWA